MKFRNEFHKAKAKELKQPVNGLWESGPQINAIGDWERIEFTVDSGAAETVIPSMSLKSVPTVSGEKHKNGIEYESACGTKIPNEGEKKCLLSTADAPAEKPATFQVADIHKSLMSVSKMVDRGNTVCFGPEGSWVFNPGTSEYTTLRRKGGLFVMDAWVRSMPGDSKHIDPKPSGSSQAPGFTRPGMKA